MKKLTAALITIALSLGLIFTLGGCASIDRWTTDVYSDFTRGLDREINVYTANGDLIAHYEGKIDIRTGDGGVVKFDYNGNRYIYYNCFVEIIAKK